MKNAKDKAYVEAQMLIRKPAKTVFESFIDPDITTSRNIFGLQKEAADWSGAKK